jgi:NADPH:quinone reductase-like Zn-dependent oxidoreductase
MNEQIIITRAGGPEVLSLIDSPLAAPRAGEVRIRVHAAGVAYADILMRKGVYPGAPRMPFVPGYDVVGTIEMLGPGVAGFRPGQLVAAMTTTGGYTQYCTVAASELVLVPEGIDAAVAVSALLNYSTAYQLLHRATSTQAGEQILVHGAAGGVGSALLELGKLAGLRIYGTASAAKHDLVRQLGATPLDYRAADLVERVRDLSAGGVDVVYDGVGGASFSQSYRMLRPQGRLIAYGVGPAVARSHFPQLGLYSSIARLLWLRLIPDGHRVTFYMINQLKRQQPAWFREDLATVFGLIARRAIQPIVSAQLPLSQAAAAHEMMEAGQSRGKIVLLP